VGVLHGRLHEPGGRGLGWRAAQSLSCSVRALPAGTYTLMVMARLPEHGQRRSAAVPGGPRPSAVPGYHTALVPIFGDDVSAAAIGRVAKLIGKGGVVNAVFVLPVPPQLPLQEGLEQEEARGRSVLESARIQARRAGIRIHTGVIRTRNPGAALVDEALRLEADMIYWSTLHAPAGERRIGPTALHLLSRRPCRVIIETEGHLSGASGDTAHVSMA